jgi:hypothetical protein
MKDKSIQGGGGGGEGGESEKQQKTLNSNVTGNRRENLRCTQKSSCSKDGEERKRKRVREREEQIQNEF